MDATSHAGASSLWRLFCLISHISTSSSYFCTVMIYQRLSESSASSEKFKIDLREQFFSYQRIVFQTFKERKNIQLIPPHGFKLNLYYGRWSSQGLLESAGVKIRLIQSLRLRFWYKFKEKKTQFEPFPFPSCITGVILSVLIGGRIKIDFFVFLTLSIKMASVAITTLTLVRFSSECRVNFNWIDSSWWCTSRGVLHPIPGIVLKK